ncbi:MAG: hypothetical protein E7L17_14030 [Clostridium sp.]|uniref:hypothetical protein n=1 Tax=Clostridium sp. TaxID=1506 RepID=UPI00290C2F8D|nr:hypothetical protein [Clostridium sp.]MDU7339217.1 hypothetical protein [Clostridium sp.]
MDFRIWDKESPINTCPADKAMAALNITATDDVYIILDENGKDWILQTQSNCPHPGTTIVESAQNHINTILTEQAQASQAKVEEQSRNEQITDLQAAVDNLVISSLEG